MLLHLPDGYKAQQVRDALSAKIQTLPQQLRASLTWDHGAEMRDWKTRVDADIEFYFCDPHAPWQRATNENTNGLLRQYSPKAATSPCTAPVTSTSSPTSSTTIPANA
jgi:IS30 family transposase